MNLNIYYYIRVYKHLKTISLNYNSKKYNTQNNSVFIVLTI